MESTNLALPATDFYRNYNLDLTGNWVSQGGTPAVTFTHDCSVHGSQDRTTNNLNQVATENGSPLSYDAKGNLLGDGTLTLAYDAFNRLITASGTGPDGNRVRPESIKGGPSQGAVSRWPGPARIPDASAHGDSRR